MDALTVSRRAGFDAGTAKRNGHVDDRIVVYTASSDGRNAENAMFRSVLSRIHTFRYGAYLIWLENKRLAGLLFDRNFQPLDIGDRQIVADEHCAF